MKQKLFISFLAVLGVFLMVDIPLLAQSTGTSSEESSSSSRSRATKPARRTHVTVPQAPHVPDVGDVDVFEYDHGYVYTSSSSEKNSKLSLSKRYEGASTSKKGTFTVDDDIKKIRVSISGRVESGEIAVEIFMPDKKEIGKFTVDETADLSWSHSINIEEGETKYYGEWTYIITTKEAHGSYHLSLSTY